MRSFHIHDPEANFEALRKNSYPGRGLVAGVDETGNYLVQICWIMGRSDNSRNRVYKRDGGRVYTNLAKPDPSANAKLTIYNAMDEAEGNFVASNGDQTDTALRGLQNGISLLGMLNTRSYEPDAPHYTPRITVASIFGPTQHIIISALRKRPVGMETQHDYYTYGPHTPGSWKDGIGWCITTYRQDSDPLPTFMGEPYPVPLKSGIKEVTQTFWDVLNEENRVALAVKFINRNTRHSRVEIINKF